MQNREKSAGRGFCSIEAAITSYVKKYAKTKKIKDLVETFEEFHIGTGNLLQIKSFLQYLLRPD